MIKKIFHILSKDLSFSFFFIYNTGKTFVYRFSTWNFKKQVTYHFKIVIFEISGI